MSESSPEGRQAKSIVWDLKDLYRNPADLEDDLQQAERQAAAFSQEYRTRVANLAGDELLQALTELESVEETIGRAYSYAYLDWSSDTSDPLKGALLQRVREATAQVQKQILFFELEWSRVESAQAQPLTELPQLARFRHYLEIQSLFKDYLLSEPEEKILSEKVVTGRSAWGRYFDQTLGSLRFSYRDRQLSEQEVLSKLYSADRSERRDAALSLTEGLETRLSDLTYVFNVVLADKASDDRLRNYPHWLSSRNLSNEVQDETVQALVETVTENYNLVASFYQLKRRLLGLEELYDYDRYAPLSDSDRRVSWDAASEVVLAAYSDFHPRMGDTAHLFFKNSWIDAALRPGKRGGAFSHSTVPSAHPYILMNYTGNIRDVQTLAHEMGHGVHQYMSRERGALSANTPLTTAEMASIFGEMLVFERLMQQETDPEVQLALLAAKIDDTIATVFRQVSMNQFEERIHQHRRKKGELSSDELSEYWMATQSGMFEGSVHLLEHYRIWWSYIPHFIHTPGYVYAYAFGELLVLSLFSKYQDEGESFAEDYLEVLRAGGSDWPHKLMARLNVDLSDPSFWNQGIAHIETHIRRAGQLADKVG